MPTSKNNDDVAHNGAAPCRAAHEDESVPVGNISATASALVISAADKAGMEGIDRARIDAIILRESGNSAFMRQQRKRDQNVNEKIEQMRKRLAEQDSRFGAQEWRRKQEVALEPEIDKLLSLRKSRSTCVVVDMDSFFISCELLSRPELNNVPCCVGGGMISTSNYCARRYGVRSAMAGWIGDTLVSELSGGKEKLIHLPSNFQLYTELAHKVRKVVSEYDPHMRAYSLDEAYLDIGPYVALKLGKGLSHEVIVAALSTKDEDIIVEENRSDQRDVVKNCQESSRLESGNESRSVEDLAEFPQELSLTTAASVVEEMRRRVHEATGLTCSVGLASNFMIAKIASDRNKPNGQLVVAPAHEDVLSFVRGLPIRKIPGVGRVTEKTLNAFNINTIKDLFDQRALVLFLFKPATGQFLLRASLGCSNSDGISQDDEPSERKGISRERTFRAGECWAQVNSRLEDIARKLSLDMKERNLKAHTITLKVKLDTFDVMSRSRTLARGVYLQEADAMVSLATEMLLELKKQRKGGSFSVRLLGVRCSNFQGDEEKVDPGQMNMEQFLCSSLRNDGGGLQGKRSMSPMATTAQVNNTNNSVAPVDPPLSPATPMRSESSSSRVTCPMCQQAIAGKDNDALNRHIDGCLNASVVRKAVREESAAADERETRKKQRLTDFFGATT